MFARFARAALVTALVAGSPAKLFAQGNHQESSGASVATEEITLQLGEQQVLPADGVRSYSEGVRGVVDVRLTKDASQFIIVALQPGETTLLFLMTDGSERHYKIQVVDPNASKRLNRDEGVEARENIRLDFYFVELDKTYSHQIGLGWPASVSSQFNASVDVKGGILDSATAVVTNQALPRLDMGQTNGWAKIMRQAAVVTENGEKASFSGGQEVNILVQTALSTGVQKLQAGSVIDVEPHYDPKSGRIELRLHADISEFVDDQGSGVPGRTTSALDTVVNLELGQSIVLGGLTARSQRNDKTGLPGLSQIPILGVLFGSHRRAESETENVAVIVPSVVDAASMQDRSRIADALRRYSDYSGELDDRKFVPDAKIAVTKRATP